MAWDPAEWKQQDFGPSKTMFAFETEWQAYIPEEWQVVVVILSPTSYQWRDIV